MSTPDKKYTQQEAIDCVMSSFKSTFDQFPDGGHIPMTDLKKIIETCIETGYEYGKSFMHKKIKEIEKH